MGVAALALALSSPAWADFTGKAVAVADGDTIAILVEKQQYGLFRLVFRLCCLLRLPLHIARTVGATALERYDVIDYIAGTGAGLPYR